MPNPELKLEDTQLSRALDELAKLVDAPVQNLVPNHHSSSLSDSDDGETENLIPQPILEPIPIEVPLPPTPVVITPPINASLEAAPESVSIGERKMFEELAALSEGTIPKIQTGRESTADPRRVPSLDGRFRVPTLLASVLSIILFVGGMLTERFIRLFEGFSQPRGAVAQESKKGIAENELSGRITWKTPEGENQPDRGARILIFPEQRSGEVKLSVVGFRPSDSPADQLVANAALKAMGGSAATADEQGGFRLPIEAGTYRILVLSHFQPRAQANTDLELDKLLAQYFEAPATLIGKVEHQFVPLRIKGTNDIWDHSF